jgi:BirA family biotin operon repressor/biotin-[acetyl-CoA-carboxylase] ligase
MGKNNEFFPYFALMDTMFVGQLLFSLNEVNSTNDFLIKKLESERLLEGTIVTAKQQTNGKGQRGKSWLSSNGQSLLFSLLLYPKCAIQQQFYLNKAVAVSICQALSEINIQAKIKWPNDIYVGKKKNCGYLNRKYNPFLSAEAKYSGNWSKC